MSSEDINFGDVETVSRLVNQWNNDRIPMFAMTIPNKDGVFHGIVRLFYYDSFNKVLSKCVKISSKDTTMDVLRTLLKKSNETSLFLNHLCSIYEVYCNGDYTLLMDNDLVLVSQLKWAQEGREGRFFVSCNSVAQSAPGESSLNQKSSQVKNKRALTGDNEKKIKDLFKDAPDNPLRSSISNHDARLKRQRQDKLNKKINEFLEYERKYGNQGENTAGLPVDKPKLGTLKIFATSIFPDAPYKTVIASIHDTTKAIIKETLDKFRLAKMEVDEGTCYLTMLMTPRQEKRKGKHLGAIQKEYCILDDERPLYLQNKYSSDSCIITFHLRRRISHGFGTDEQICEEARKVLAEKRYFAVLCEMNAQNVTKPPDHPRFIALNKDVVAIGNNSFCVKQANYLGQCPTQCIVLKQHSIHKLHCVISSLNGILSVTPILLDADVRVDGVRIYETTTLLHGSRLCIGCSYYFLSQIPTKTSATTSPLYWAKNQPTNLCVKEAENNCQFAAMFDENFNKILLPIQLSIHEKCFYNFTLSVVNLLQKDQCTFKLSVAYLLYMTLINQYETFMSSSDSDKKSSEITTKSLKEFHKSCNTIVEVFDDFLICHTQHLRILVLWLANASEFLNFIKQDVLLHCVTTELQNFIEQCIRVIFNEVTLRLEGDITILLPCLLSSIIESRDIPEEFEYIMNFDPGSAVEERALRGANDETNDGIVHIPLKIESFITENRPSRLSDIIECFNDWLMLMCTYHLNPSFTVQMFTRIFNFMCNWLVNRFIMGMFTDKSSCVNCGETLKVRMHIVNLWAESQGLEMIALKCFKPLDKVISFLLRQVDTLADLKQSVEQCNILNSTQIRKMLDNWRQSFNELRNVTANWVDEASAHAGVVNDPINEAVGNVRSEYIGVGPWPCFVTHDGYYSELPATLAGDLVVVLGRLDSTTFYYNQNKFNTTIWNCRFKDYLKVREIDKKAEYMFIGVNRQNSEPLGMKIVSVRNSATDNMGIYIKDITENSLIAKNGRFSVGDQIISVNGRSLIGVDENMAASIIFCSGLQLNFEVLKNSAELHGIKMPKKFPNSTELRPSYDAFLPAHQKNDLIESEKSEFPLKKEARDNGTCPTSTNKLPLYDQASSFDLSLCPLSAQNFPDSVGSFYTRDCLQSISCQKASTCELTNPNQLKDDQECGKSALQDVQKGNVQKRAQEYEKIVRSLRESQLRLNKLSNNNVDNCAQSLDNVTSELDYVIPKYQSAPNSSLCCQGSFDFSPDKSDDDAFLPPRPPLPKEEHVLTKNLLKKEYC